MYSCQGPSGRSVLGRSEADPMIHLVHKETDSFWMNEIVLFLCSKAYNPAVNFSGDFYIFTWKENSTTVLVQSLVGSFLFYNDDSHDYYYYGDYWNTWFVAKKIFPHNIFVRMETLILSHTINMGLGMLKNQRRFGLLRLKSSMLDETYLYR